MSEPFRVETLWWCPTCKQIRRHPTYRDGDNRFHSYRHGPMQRVVMSLAAVAGNPEGNSE